MRLAWEGSCVYLDDNVKPCATFGWNIDDTGISLHQKTCIKGEGLGEKDQGKKDQGEKDWENEYIRDTY